VRAPALASVGLLFAVAACSSSAPHANGSPTTTDAGDAARYDGAVCGTGDVMCADGCHPESVSACGASCTMCPQPATSHGTADCVAGQCTFQCAGGYAMCATRSCCGSETMGDVAAIAVGGTTTCAATSAGLVGCWGTDAYGALGDGMTSGFSPVPVQANGLKSVTALSLGDRHGCALTMGGTVRCWGDDTQGQLGDGNRSPSGTATIVSGITGGATAVAAGGMHTCAILGGGAVSCWGDNMSGQLGNGRSTGSSVVPVAVTGLASGATAIAAGEAFTCAVVSGGSVMCWGDGLHGQLGGPASSATPTAVAMPASVTALAAGANHVCALMTGGSVVCWGADDQGQLGSTLGEMSAKPVAVQGLTGVVAIAAGGNESCALDGAGAVHCWGQDPVGDVGSGPARPGIVPSLTSGIAHISVVTGHACAVTAGGAPKCWGTNDSGDLGDGTVTPSWAPIDVRGI
jgi:alpha-tubulin suppressor-like RCC1 family protein